MANEQAAQACSLRQRITAAGSCEVDEALRGDGRAVVFTLNAFLMYLCVKDKETREFLNRSNIVTCDSRILAAASRFLGSRLPIKTGSDIVASLVKVEARTPIVVIGPDQAAIRSIDSPCKLLPIECPYLADPEQLWIWVKGELQSILSREELAAKEMTYLVALGPRKQEFVANRLLEEFGVARIICCGASIDFLIGKERRAPVLFQKIGLEWFWRLIQNPRRKWKAVLIYSPIGLYEFIKDMSRESSR